PDRRLPLLARARGPGAARHARGRAGRPPGRGRGARHLRVLQPSVPFRRRDPGRLRAGECRRSMMGGRSRMRIALRLLSALIFTSLLAGCDTPPTRGTFPKLTYAYLTPFRLAGSRAAIVAASPPPLAAPNVEQSFPVSPSGTAAQWGRDRLIAVGGPD